MTFDTYWYVVAESGQLGATGVLARRILDERLVCFRAEDGRSVVLRDRCLHRNAPLSGGVVRGGRLCCPYHGWVYDGDGRVVAIPSLAGNELPAHCSRPFPVVEQDGYIYVCLRRDATHAGQPFPMPHYGEAGWTHLRLQNRFANDVANCIENFIDIPHTAFVHRGLFRSTRGERLTARLRRADGAVHVTYGNERSNLGTYRWFMNPGGDEIRHTDSFHVPNISSVTYEIGTKVFVITSQAVPVDGRETLVFTDLTYRFGAWSALAAPFVRRHGQRIIDQDIEILALQGENIARYGAEFRDTPADRIHQMVDSLRDAIARGEDPRRLPVLEETIEFRV